LAGGWFGSSACAENANIAKADTIGRMMLDRLNAFMFAYPLFVMPWLESTAPVCAASRHRFYS
jgi:hypothetical protein